VKRRDLLRHLAHHGCAFLREGGNHTLYINRIAKKVSTIPRRNEINRDLARKICTDLQVPRPPAS
jgi:mRNA interferase HicA